MRNVVFLLLILLQGMVSSSAYANAFRPNPALRSQGTPVHSLSEGTLTIAPMAFVQFCMKYSGQCDATGAEKVTLTETQLAELKNVNISVNSKIAGLADVPGRDEWSLNVSKGDCDDFAVQKRADLIVRGWPARALSLAAVQTRQGEHHLVLTIRTSEGDLVLDNLTNQIRFFDETNYRWLKRQSSSSPVYWVELLIQ